MFGGIRLNILDTFFKRKSNSAGGIEYIIAGLGNPGGKYIKTRHNAGFIAAEHIAAQIGEKFKNSKFKGLTASGKINGKNVLILKPETYMNESGRSVFEAMSYYKIPPENVIIMFDDITLDVGKIRIRRNGSHGGHNGIKSIINICGSDKFPRVKIGVGDKPSTEWDLAKWVLSSFSDGELIIMNKLSNNIINAVELIVSDKIEEAMNKFN